MLSYNTPKPTRGLDFLSTQIFDTRADNGVGLKEIKKYSHPSVVPLSVEIVVGLCSTSTHLPLHGDSFAP